MYKVKTGRLFYKNMSLKPQCKSSIYILYKSHESIRHPVENVGTESYLGKEFYQQTVGDLPYKLII